MPNMSRPVQQRRQVERQPAEYATKADVEILAAEVHGFREATEAEIRGLRESTKADVEVLAAEVREYRKSTEAEIRGLRESVDARFEKVEAEIREYRKSTEAEIRGFREATDARLSAHDQMLDRIERHLERMAVDHRAAVRWIVGSALALGGLILAVLRFGQTGVG